jgi:hypothetical protein
MAGTHPRPELRSLPDQCFVCGLLYRDFRAPDASWDEAYTQVWRESVALAQLGNYGRPASRRAILGRMRELKLAEWSEHLAYCEQADEAGPWAQDAEYQARRDARAAWVPEDSGGF